MTPRDVRVAAVSSVLTLSLLAAATSATQAVVYTPGNNTTFTMTIATVGPATPGSTIIKIYGTATTISDVNVTLNGVTHSNADDLDIELVGPDGTAVPLVSDVCGSNVSGATITLDDQAPTAAPDTGPCFAGSYRPNNVGGGDTWDVTPTDATLAAFNSKVANGSWTLYVRDDSGLGGTGTIAGWSLTITTAATAAMAIPGPTSTAGSGVASPYPLPITVSGRTGTVADVNLVLPGLTHSAPGDLDVLLVGPGGGKVIVMSDACGVADAAGVTLTLDDQAAASMPASGGCATGSYQPTDFGSPDTMTPPAPAGPYGSALAAFNGTAPNGVWNLYLRDDGSNFDTGWLLGAPTLQIATTTGQAPGGTAPGTTITKSPKSSTKTRAKLKFTSTEAGSTFQCKVDKKKWKTCTSPLKLKNLKVGKHKVKVRAIDAGGLTDATPAKASWRVKKPPS